MGLTTPPEAPDYAQLLRDHNRGRCSSTCIYRDTDHCWNKEMK